MLRTLRRRFILSHTLPVLVIIPIMGIALVYVLETQVLLVNLADELTHEAKLVAKMAEGQERVWQDPLVAEGFVANVGRGLDARLMLLDSTGRLLASSDPTDAARAGEQIGSPGLVEAAAGQIRMNTSYNSRLDGEVADVLLPVTTAEGQVVGIVRLTHRLSSIYADFLRLRYLVAGILAVGLILGAGAGWLLAVDLANPLRRVTSAVGTLSGDKRTVPEPKGGPEEVALLVRTFNSQVEQIKVAEESRRQMLANLVHELGRPLGALQAGVQALRSGADEDVGLRRELLAGVDEELKRLKRVLDDLAQLNDHLVGTLRLSRRPVDLNEWLIHLLATWRRAAEAKGLRWEATAPVDLPTAEVDPDRLAQALGNLLSNAVKYTPAGGLVAVSAGQEGDSLWIEVQDTGPGVAPEEQAKIFTAFYRGAAAGRFPQGMGLGLTIARDLVHAHDGWLELASSPGRGTRFTIRLPLKASGAGRAP
ncbi:MAG: sensor histidine kinase [Chloroflexota bacterium]